MAGKKLVAVAAAVKLKRDSGLDYKPEEIIISTGAKQVLFNAMLGTLNAGDEVIIPSPCWVSYPDIVSLSDGKPVLVPDGTPTSLGSGIFALLAAGAFSTIEEAQKSVCLPYRSYVPQPKSVAVYNELYALYRKAYFALGKSGAAATPLGMILPELRRIATAART